MSKTRHFQTRMSQRGITGSMLDVVLRFGVPQGDHIKFGRKAADAALKELDELRKQLLSIKGVGPYAAATLLMLLGRYDFLPVDSWSFKLVSTEFHGGNPVGKAEVEAAFEQWGEWKALAYWFWDWELLRQIRG